MTRRAVGIVACVLGAVSILGCLVPGRSVFGVVVGFVAGVACLLNGAAMVADD